MPITLDRARGHVARWAPELAKYPTRAMWPSHVFHTAQIEVAVNIIREGAVKCRSDVDDLIWDVANQGALWNNPGAHQYVRTYFRPRNGYHLKTEGIKSLSDVYRSQKHMCIPITFAFLFESSITNAGSYFTYGNFAQSDAELLDGDDAFDGLDFSLIYHDSAPPRERMAEIQNVRMSEVVFANPLSLNSLACVVCRTTHEQRMLEYLLHQQGIQPPKIIVEQRGAIFFRRAMFIEELYIRNNRLQIRFTLPTTAPQPNYKLDVQADDNKHGCRRLSYVLEGGGPWSIEQLPAESDTIWGIWIEDCLAFKGPVPATEGLIF